MTEICYTIRGSGCVFIISSFREVPGWCSAKKSSSNIRKGKPEEEQPTIRVWMRVQVPPLFLSLFRHFILTATARYDIVKMSIRHVPALAGVIRFVLSWIFYFPSVSRGDPGSMPGSYMIDGHFHPFGESCE